MASGVATPRPSLGPGDLRARRTRLPGVDLVDPQGRNHAEQIRRAVYAREREEADDECTRVHPRDRGSPVPMRGWPAPCSRQAVTMRPSGSWTAWATASSSGRRRILLRGGAERCPSGRVDAPSPRSTGRTGQLRNDGRYRRAAGPHKGERPPIDRRRGPGGFRPVGAEKPIRPARARRFGIRG